MDGPERRGSGLTRLQARDAGQAGLTTSKPAAWASQNSEPVEQLLDALAETRARTLTLVSELDEQTLRRVHSTLLSPLIWDLGHIGAFEDLWIARALGRTPLRPDLSATYDADETPRALRGELQLLATGETFEYMAAVRARTLAYIESGDVVDPDWLELVIRHEQQHNETMLQGFQLAHLPTPLKSSVPAPGGQQVSGLEFVELPGGTVAIGADPAASFAYDNEHPRHHTELKPFAIASAPVTNGDWAAFIDDGGYQRREWWSAEGWEWREREAASAPLHWSADGRIWQLAELLAPDPSAPVTHVSFHEAQAFANAHGARLATEPEWEFAATWDPVSGTQRPYPWGSQPPTRARANIDQISGGADPVPSRPDGATTSGLQAMIGDVWEWTSSPFTPYPGFVAYPYREYSEQFFGGPYQVLRGGSWATRPRITTSAFRNWDLPERRQIFSGVRLASDA